MSVNFHLTDAGRLALVNANALSVDLKLTHIAFGSGKYIEGFAAKTELVSEFARYPLTGGQVIESTATLQLVAEITAEITADVFEVGFFTESGVLFAVASQLGLDTNYPSNASQNVGRGPIAKLVNQVTSLFTFGMVFVDVNFERVVVNIAPDSSLATILMNNHLGHPDPHPQYAMDEEFEQFKTEITNDFNLMKRALVDSIWGVDSWHGVDNVTYDPSIALEPIFGYRTVWRLRPYAPYGVENLTQAILQKLPIASNTGLLALSGPIWKRMPDDYQDPEYALFSDKNTVNEGGLVTFTLQTQNLNQGEAVGWQISGVSANDISPSDLIGFFTVGENGAAEHNISIVNDLTTEGSETLRLSLIDEPSVFKEVVIVDTSISLNKTYRLTINQALVSAGDTVNVTLVTNDVANGEVLNYSIAGLDASSLSSTTGSFTIQNNQATTSFNVIDVDTQRQNPEITVTLQNNLASVSVAKQIPIQETIIDLSSVLETVQSVINDAEFGNVWIKEPCNLRSVFNAELGRGPNVNEHIRFIVPENFAIIGSVTRSPAITSGAWRTSNQVTIENHGYILGRGGALPRNIDGRGVGGDAIVNDSSIEIKIENNHWLAGGGGAGGYAAVHGGAGAPFGKYLNASGQNVVNIENGGYMPTAAVLGGFANGGRGMRQGDPTGIGTIEGEVGYGGDGGAWGEKGGDALSRNNIVVEGNEAGLALNGQFEIVVNTGTIKGRDYP